MALNFSWQYITYSESSAGLICVFLSVEDMENFFAEGSLQYSAEDDVAFEIEIAGSWSGLASYNLGDCSETAKFHNLSSTWFLFHQMGEQRLPHELVVLNKITPGGGWAHHLNHVLN